MTRSLEGEAYLHQGVIYIAKGYQHPDGYVVAYPRYNALNRSKLLAHEYIKHGIYKYWDCIKQVVPLIPLKKSFKLYSTYNIEVSYILEFIRSLLDREKEVYLTGSSLINKEFNDIDVVIYGSDESTVDNIERLFNQGVLSRSYYILIREHREKHFDKMKLEEYLKIKKNTILHGLFRNIHVNFKLVELEKGFNTCIDPVEKYSIYTGLIEVVKPINPHLIPARYVGIIGGEEITIESLREIYAELTPGKYYAENARVEDRSSDRFLVPDLGVLKPVNLG
ncbi:MAG: hypothetical protein QXE81_06720 [Desulfurococcaceae archaeon]